MIPLEIVNKTLSGSEVSYTIPDNVRVVAFQANCGEITMPVSSREPTWKIADGSKEAISNVNLANRTYYFNGTATLEIRLEYGTTS